MRYLSPVWKYIEFKFRNELRCKTQVYDLKFKYRVCVVSQICTFFFNFQSLWSSHPIGVHWISGGFLFSFSFGSSKKNVILSYIVHTISKLFTIGSRAWLINIGNRLKWFYRTGKFDYFKGNKNDLVEILAVQPYLTPLQSCWSKQVYLRVRVWCIWEGFGFSFKGCPLKCR